MKAALRQEIAVRLRAADSQGQALAAQQARIILEQQHAWIRATSVLFYAPLASELDIWGLLIDALVQGKLVALPRFDPVSQRYIPCRICDAQTDIVSGRFGIREPHVHCEIITANQLDLILVPGVAFDTRGNRLGRGKGYYDRLLAGARGIKCGVAFDEQIVENVPVEPHDVAVDCIVTPTRWIEAPPRAVLE